MRPRLMHAGLIVVVLAGCGGGKSGAGPSAAAGPSASPPVVTMTIADGSTLEQAVPWVVTASATGSDLVDNVRFLIDGKERWKEVNPPYSFDDDGQVLAPWLLGAGPHELTAHVTTLHGVTGDATAHVTVVADLSKNTLVAGTYRRTVTAADQKRVAGYRTAAYGAFGDMSPTGTWTLRVQPDGTILGSDPEGHGVADAFVEPYTVRGDVLRLYGPAIWFQQDPAVPQLFCEPERAGDYTWSLSGGSLTLKNVQRVCADRDIVLVGTWKRV